MNRNKFAISAALLAIAFGAQAQTVETDYPVMTGNINAVAPAAIAKDFPSAVPFLMQSNFEGVKVRPAHAQPSTLTREDVRSGATVEVPPVTGHNA
ncbi:MAG TPA: hypothetical protein PK177_06125 [Burkholderiaceae bacterium]|nr:hypothetical protein [Burkholderiaceae bacterium]